MPIIRPFRDGDAAILVEMIDAAIFSTAPEFYSKEQVSKWAARMPDAARLIARSHDGRHAFVACDENELPVALAELEANGHLDFLYCHPDHSGKGHASALYDRLEKTAKILNLSEIYVEASESALTLFRHKGFSTTKRQVFDMDGVTMHNYAMRKGLNVD